MAPGLNSQPEINRNDEEWEELYTMRPANHHFKQAWGLLRVINMSLQFIQTWTWTWCRPWTWPWTWVFALLLSLKTRPFQVLQDQHQTSKQGSRSEFRWPPNNQNIRWHCLWRSIVWCIMSAFIWGIMTHVTNTLSSQSQRLKHGSYNTVITIQDFTVTLPWRYKTLWMMIMPYIIMNVI